MTKPLITLHDLKDVVFGTQGMYPLPYTNRPCTLSKIGNTVLAIRGAANHNIPSLPRNAACNTLKLHLRSRTTL